MLKYLFVVMSVFVPWLVQADNAPNPKQEAQAKPADKNPDKTLALKVIKTLKDDPKLEPLVKNLTISVDEGEVTLGGTVETDRSSNQVERKVSEISGVESVNNDIEVTK